MNYNESSANAHWQTLKLRELGDFSRGLSKHRPRNDVALFSGGGYPLIQTGEIREANLYITSHHVEYGEFGLRQSKLWDADTLCITIAANIAETAILSYPMCFPDSVVGFTANKKLTSELFVYYVFEYIRMAIKNAASGSAQDNINIEYLTSLEFKVPNKAVQDSIVGVLASLDRMILLNNQVNDNLQAMLQTLYGYWFLQFDFPDETGRPYRSSGGRMVWNERLKREIPEGWGVASLVSNPLCEPLKPGVAPFSEKTYLATADVVGTTIKNGSRIRYETREGRANMEPVLNSVWFAKMKGSIKHLFLNEACASLIDETILSTGFVGLKCEPEAFEYIASFIASEQFEPLKDLHAHGATQQAVNNADLENILLPVPDAETLSGFSQLASSVLSRFNASTIENKRLQDLRDWLLPMLMNGQATVASSDKLSFT